MSRLSSIRVNLEQVWPRLNNKVDFYQQQWLANRQRFQLTLRSFGKDLDNFERSFDLVDPQHLLRQGYSLVSDSTGKIIRSWSDVELDQLLIVQLHIGQLITVVKKKSSKK